MGYPGQMQVFIYRMYLFVFKLKTTSDDSWWFQECFGKCNPSFTLYTDHLPKPAQVWLASRIGVEAETRKLFFSFLIEIYIQTDTCVTRNWVEFRQQSADTNFSVYLSGSSAFLPQSAPDVWLEQPPTLKPVFCQQHCDISPLFQMGLKQQTVAVLQGSHWSYPATTCQSYSSHYVLLFLFIFFSLGLAGTHKTHFKTSQK